MLFSKLFQLFADFLHALGCQRIDNDEDSRENSNTCRNPTHQQLDTMDSLFCLNSSFFCIEAESRKIITEEIITPVMSSFFISLVDKRLTKTEPYSSAVRFILEETRKDATKTSSLNIPYLMLVLPISIASNIIFPIKSSYLQFLLLLLYVLLLFYPKKNQINL